MLALPARAAATHIVRDDHATSALPGPHADASRGRRGVARLRCDGGDTIVRLLPARDDLRHLRAPMAENGRQGSRHSYAYAEQGPTTKSQGMTKCGAISSPDCPNRQLFEQCPPWSILMLSIEELSGGRSGRERRPLSRKSRRWEFDGQFADCTVPRKEEVASHPSGGRRGVLDVRPLKIISREMQRKPFSRFGTFRRASSAAARAAGAGWRQKGDIEHLANWIIW